MPGADQQATPDQPVGGRSVGQAGSSPQEAVKILSLRVPKTLPSNAPVSRALLTSPGSAAPGAGGLDSLVQALMRAFKPQTPTGAPEQPQMPQGPQPSRQTMPTFPTQGPAPTPPTFEGNIDTPPLQNAPQLPDGPLYGGGYMPPNDPADLWTNGIRDGGYGFSMSDFFTPWVPTKPYLPNIMVDNQKSGSGQSGQNA